MRFVLAGRSPVPTPVTFPHEATRGRIATPTAGEVCESFTAADGFWDGSADLTWAINDGGPSPDTGGFYIASNALELRADTLGFNCEGAATTDDFGITSADCWCEFDFVSIGDNNPGVREISYAELTIGLRCAAAWDRGGSPYAIEFVLGVYGSTSSAFAGPSWSYYAYDEGDGNYLVDESGTEIEGTPIGHWRYEVQGDDWAIFFDEAPFDSGTYASAPLGDYGRYIGVAAVLGQEVTPPDDTRGPQIDNLCAGNL